MYICAAMIQEDFKLRVFVTVAHAGGFSAAARKLGVSQSAVSQRISELEKECGEQLFVRSHSEVALSEAGQKLMPYAQEILHWYGAANDALSGAQADGPTEVRLSDDKVLEVWGSGGEIHLKIK